MCSQLGTEAVSKLSSLKLNVNALEVERDSEARALRELNEKLGNYIERVLSHEFHIVQYSTILVLTLRVEYNT